MKAIGAPPQLPKQLSPTHDSRVERWTEYLWAIVATPLAIYLMFVAWRLTIDYYDSYDIFLNARCIATGFSRDWRAWRSLGMPLLLSPCFAIERSIGSTHFGFRMSHLVAVALWMALLFLCFAMFRLHLRRFAAGAAVFLLTLNPLLVHYAPMAKEDIAASTFTVACFYAYLRASPSNSRKGFVTAGVFAGLAMVMRQNLPPVVLGVLLTAELMRAYHRRASIQSHLIAAGLLLVLPLAIFFLSPELVYPPIGMSSISGAPGMLLQDMWTHAQFIHGHWHDEGAAKNFRFVAEALTFPVCAIAIAGMIVAWRRRICGAAFYAAWFAIFFGFQALEVKHSEARYLFPAFPPLYFFAGVTIETIGAWTVRINSRLRALALPAALALAIVVPLLACVRECVRFTDPIYTGTFTERVARFAAERSGNRPIRWLGPYYPLHPRDFVFDLEDETTSIYHVGVPPVLFWGGVPVEELFTEKSDNGEIDQLVLDHPEAIPSLQDGDVFIVNSESSSYTTLTLPPKIRPLAIRTLRLWKYGGATDSTQLMPLSPASVTGSMRTEVSEGAVRVQGSGFPCHRIAILLKSISQHQAKLFITEVKKGHFEMDSKVEVGASPLSAIVLFFDSKTEFTPP